MKKKIQKEYVEQGFGFPVILKDVPLVQIRGTWVPAIRYGALQRGVLLKLALMATSFQGVHVRFIRKWLGLTLQEFGGLFNVSHAAVSKWERSGEKAAKITPAIELAIRLHVLDAVVKDAAAFRRAYRELASKGFHGKRVLRIAIQMRPELIKS